MSGSLPPSRRTLTLAALLSAAAGVGAVGQELLWADFYDRYGFQLLSILTVALYGSLAVAAPISVGVTAARAVRAGTRAAAKSSGLLTLGFVLPGTLLVTAREAWMTASTKAVIIEEFSEFDPMIAIIPSPAVVAGTVFGLSLAVAAVAWGVVLTVAVVVARVTDGRLKGRTTV